MTTICQTPRADCCITTCALEGVAAFEVENGLRTTRTSYGEDLVHHEGNRPVDLLVDAVRNEVRSFQLVQLGLNSSIHLK
eukprot:8123545-Pyramimonas_sp.AAC.1